MNGALFIPATVLAQTDYTHSVHPHIVIAYTSQPPPRLCFCALGASLALPISSVRLSLPITALPVNHASSMIWLFRLCRTRTHSGTQSGDSPLPSMSRMTWEGRWGE